MQIVRTMEEIEQLQEDADYINASDGTDPCPGLGYVDGLISTIDWLTGRTDEYPLLPKE